MLQKVIHFFSDIRYENKMLTFYFFFSQEPHTLKLRTHVKPNFAFLLYSFAQRLLRDPIKMRKCRDGQVCLWVASV